MKILEIVPGLQSGGAERLVVDLCNEFADMGHDVTLLSIKDLNKDNRDFYLSQLSPHVHVINLEGDRGRFTLTKDINRIIRDNSFDIVHGHLVMDYLSIPVLTLHNKTKFFTTIHINISNILGYKKSSKIARGFLVKVLGRFGWIRFITISDNNYQDMRTMYPYAGCTLIYNGRKKILPSQNFDAVKEEIQKLKSSGQSIVFLHIARCSHQKNQHLLIDSFNKLNEDGLDAELLIIGSGFDSTPLGKALQEKAGDHIHFLGTRTNVGDYILNSDAFLLSSNFEGMPISLIEALSCGIPAVCTPVCGAVDVINNGKNGILSDEISFNSYVKALKDFIANRNKISEFAKEDAKEGKFDIHNTAEQYIKEFSR